MLRTLDEPQKEDWKNHVGRLVHAYNFPLNMSQSYTTSCTTPPSPSCDTLIGPECENEEVDYDEYMDNIQEQLQKSKVASSAPTEGYDKKVRGATLEVGDLVLV